MYQVNWRQAAFDQVAAAWRDADPALRRAIAAAVHQIGVDLQDEPDAKGESRSEGTRILIVAPLAVIFHIDFRAQTVIILRAWAFRRGRDATENRE